jgi:ATPase subunit of ABC transporter with duplicated ATPase domains
MSKINLLQLLSNVGRTTEKLVEKSLHSLKILTKPEVLTKPHSPKMLDLQEPIVTNLFTLNEISESSNVMNAKASTRILCNQPKRHFYAVKKHNVGNTNIIKRHFHSTVERRGGNINISDLDLTFGQKVIFQNLDFHLQRGEKVTIVGENGIGKSTFIKLIAGEIQDYSGKMKLNGEIGYLPQAFTETEDQPVINYLLKQSKNHELIQFCETNSSSSDSWYEAFEAFGEYNILKTMSKLRLSTQHLERNLHTLSGGEKIKVHLCALECQNPDILLLDEPTNHLDYQGLSWLEGFLKSFAGSVVMVTHDRTLINNTSDRISELSPATHNFVHFRGGYRNYLIEQDKIYERAKLERSRQEKELKLSVGKLEDSRDIVSHSVVRRSTNDRDKLGFNARGERKQKGQGKAINQLANKIETLRENLVEVPDYRKKIDIKFLKTSSEYVSIQAENLSKMFSEVNLFDSVSFNLKQGDRLVITGNNGSGKTTILRMIYGNLNPDKGSITLSKNSKIGYLDQEQENLDLDKTPLELICGDLTNKFSTTEARNFLSKFGVHHSHDLHSPLRILSIGCRRKTQLAQIVMQKPNILLLDEPTNHIDLLSLERIEEQLLTFPGIIISVSHDRYFIKKIAAQVLDMGKYRNII